MDAASYQKYRQAREDILRTIRNIMPNQAIAASVKALGWNKKRPSLLEQSYIREYALHEYGRNGKSIISTLSPDIAATASEKLYLEALREAKSSLFVVTNSNESEQEITISDLLDQTRSVTLYDDYLPQKVVEGTLLFIRPVCLKEGTVGSGTYFDIPSANAETVAAELHHLENGREKLSSKELFSFALKMFQKYGVPAIE